MARYRKKPVVVDAFQVTTARFYDTARWPQWVREAWERQAGTPGSLYRPYFSTGDHPMVGLTVGTLEGPLNVSVNDWLIKGVKGEIYPCKPDVFEATYEEVEE